jgi:hypothetical protein
MKKNSSPAIGRHTPAQGAAANTRQILRGLMGSRRLYFRAHIDVLGKTPKGIELLEKYSIECSSLSTLCQRIFDFFGIDGCLFYGAELLICLSNGRKFYWNHVLAYNCFVLGDYSICQLIREMIVEGSRYDPFNKDARAINNRRAAV